MSPPAHHRDGDRLVFPLRPDKRALAAQWRKSGVWLVGASALGVGLIGQWQTGLGAVAALAAAVGVLLAGMGALALWINRLTVVFDPALGAFEGLPIQADQVGAVRLRERLAPTRGGSERRVVLDLVLVEGLDDVQRAALATRSAPQAIAQSGGVLVTDHSSERQVLRAAKALALALERPLLDAAAQPARWIDDGAPADALVHADTPLPALPGPSPAALTVHSMRPLHVSWRGVRYQGALWAALGFVLLPFGAGTALHRGQVDGPTALLLGVPLALFGYGLLTRRGTHALRIDGRTVRSVHAGLYDMQVPADRVLGFRDQITMRGNRITGFRLPDAGSWGVFPGDEAAVEWLKAAAERAIRTGGADD